MPDISQITIAPEILLDCVDEWRMRGFEGAPPDPHEVMMRNTAQQEAVLAQSAQTANKTGASVGKNLRVASVALGTFCGEAAEMASQMVRLGSTMGVAGLAIGAVSLAMSFFSSRAEEQERQLDKLRKAHKTYTNALELTTDSIEDLIAANDRRLEQIERDKEFEEQIVKDSRGTAQKAAILVVMELGGANDELSETYQELVTEGEDLTTQNEQLAESLDSVEVAANDAREALFEQIDAETNLREFRRDALRSTAEQNAKEAQAIADRRSDIENEIQILKASGDTSKEAQDEIEKLNSELEELN
ncbi:hypothetical protein LCGC14_2818170, partial [marine sediment metagenome]